jgi:FKBP12-rapamycin complex-associated protein
VQVKRALEWLENERADSRRFAACLILTQMADNAPTVFNVQVPGFIHAIWFGLRDPKVSVDILSS